jgi:4-amino-4-deoxy-L-arabinose transferase-like glycosyltransferase
MSARDVAGADGGASSPDRRARKLTWLDAGIALALGVGFTVVLVKSVATLGYARDEGFYFHAASAYGRWLEQLWASPGAAMSRKAVDAAWAVNHEHPGLVKALFALSNLLLQKKLHLFAMEGTSYRFPAMVLAGGLLSVVYLWGAEARSRAAGGVAAVALAAMPRFFYHAHLACFDVPIVAIWTLCAYCFWKALRTTGALWPALAGLAFGLALDTKHNSWFLPIVAGAHTAGALLVSRLLPRGDLSRAAANEQLRRAAWTMGAMAWIGPLVMFALWPWIWWDTFARLREYAMFHLNHEYYNMELFGVNHWVPPMPRAYAPVMTAATVPLVTLLLFAAGLFGRARLRLGEAALLLSARAPAAGRAAGWISRAQAVFQARRLGSPLARIGPSASTELLWLLSIGAIYAAWLSPKTPIFGGTKHWMTAYPFLALFAGVGFDDVVRAARAQLLRLRKRLPALVRAPSPALAAALGALALASPVVQTARSHPWGLSSYTPLVGGAAGAATLGLNRTFWGYTTGAVADYLNTAPPGASVFLHDTAGPSWDMLLADGRLRRDIRGAWSVDGSTFALYHHEKHMAGVEHQTWISYGTLRPDHVAGLDGVPVLWVYRRPSK